MTESEIELEFVRQLVARHRVCWEVWPVFRYEHNGERKQVGFEVDLLGTHDTPAHAVTPGCDECAKTFDALRAIAKWVLPEGQRDTDYRLAPFDNSLHASKQRKFREDVELKLVLEHRTGLSEPVDPCQVRCLQEIEAALAGLGARKASWSSSSTPR
jgi:hypothetical protein